MKIKEAMLGKIFVLVIANEVQCRPNLSSSSSSSIYFAYIYFSIFILTFIPDKKNLKNLKQTNIFLKKE